MPRRRSTKALHPLRSIVYPTSSTSREGTTSSSASRKTSTSTPIGTYFNDVHRTSSGSSRRRLRGEPRRLPSPRSRTTYAHHRRRGGVRALGPDLVERPTMDSKARTSRSRTSTTWRRPGPRFRPVPVPETLVSRHRRIPAVSRSREIALSRHIPTHSR